MKDLFLLHIPIEKQMEKRKAFWNQWGGYIYKWYTVKIPNEQKIKYEKRKIEREMESVGNNENILSPNIV